MWKFFIILIYGCCLATQEKIDLYDDKVEETIQRLEVQHTDEQDAFKTLVYNMRPLLYDLFEATEKLKAAKISLDVAKSNWQLVIPPDDENIDLEKIKNFEDLFQSYVTEVTNFSKIKAQRKEVKTKISTLYKGYQEISGSLGGIIDAL